MEYNEEEKDKVRIVILDKMRRILKRYFFVFSLFCTCISCVNNSTLLQVAQDYPIYGGNKAGNRYSSLNRIDTLNVKGLRIAWMYNAADIIDSDALKQKRAKQIQCQPIVVDKVLYGTTPDLELFALDAGTGKQLWKFKPFKDSNEYGIINVNRGVTYWQNKKQKRILYTVGSRLYAINANKGEVVRNFGNNGIVDLHTGLASRLNKEVQSLSVVATTPGVIFRNNFIIGSGVAESGEAAPGHIRAFDVITGKLKWVFHTVPQPGERGYETWPKDAYKKIGAANNWGGITVDEKRGVVYLGTGSPASDFYGGDRKGSNLFANCILALNARTGELKWYYQTVHHDLWDRDNPCPPNLATITRKGKKIDVVVQATKDGLVYVLDRDNGTSIFPIEERPVPINGLPGEYPWPTQPYPVKPFPFSRQVFTEDDITNISPEAHSYVSSLYKRFRSDNKFTPPSIQGTLLFGYSGGAEWGGNAIDPSGVLYQNSNDDPWILQMIDTAILNKEIKSVSKGNGLYIKNCAGCHGQDRKGSGTQFPNLVNISNKRTFEQILEILRTGTGRMPSFQQISKGDRIAITDFLFNKEFTKGPYGNKSNRDTLIGKKEEIFGFKPAYVIKVWKKLTDESGYPGVKPPWGTLNAIDLNTGNYLWKVPLGEYPELTKMGISITGSDSYGGPLVTAGGLLFIAATRDEKIRAFNKRTGKVVWEFQLPAGGFATPITYEVNGKQYVVIAAGGGRGQKAGGKYIAFSL